MNGDSIDRTQILVAVCPGDLQRLGATDDQRAVDSELVVLGFALALSGAAGCVALLMSV